MYQPLYRKALAAGDGRVAPEHRLYCAMIGSFGLVVGLFWFAWTTGTGQHWAFCLVGAIPFAWGNLCIFLTTVLYLSDVYGAMNGASAIAANGILRYTFGAVFPLFTIQSTYLHARLDKPTKHSDSVPRPRYSMGDIPARLCRCSPASHTFHFLQVGTFHSSEKQDGVTICHLRRITKNYYTSHQCISKVCFKSSKSKSSHVSQYLTPSSHTRCPPLKPPP